ncbi:amino acid adenylation domain-containing protein [Actinophytocola sp.]|uniref:amino acid adenylation domain-containing protein n=1 Tax=Actinophytocola sp. TaxID=1872138 RepID=UPI002ED19524
MSRFDGLIPVLVARQATATPAAVAVVDEAGSLTYAELDERANRLANLLRANGIGADGAETTVGVCLHRGVALVVALLAVWRAGGAYLPLDPTDPARRVKAMLRAAGVRVALTQTITDHFVAAAGVHTVMLDRDLTVAAGRPATEPVEVTGDRAAYVLHTSGSTGTPKGVVIHHAGIANRVLWTVRTHGIGPHDRVLQKTALTFDASGWEIFAPLVCGGTVVLAPTSAERDPAIMMRVLAERKITILQVVPSMLPALIDEPGWSGCGTLRLLFSAGEQLHAELVHRFLERLPEPAAVDVWNTYGPTECAIDVTAHRFDPAQRSGPVPIGTPIDGMRATVADEHGKPLPPGAKGELLAGGVGVGRGYLGRACLTAERFVPDPAGPAGARLYRTGDLVRQRADGTLEYLGRIDHQVKVDGVRIEPGEVEAALAAYPGIRGVHVTGFPAAGGTRLAAYVHTDDGDVPSGLHEYLAERLPGTHLPASYLGMTAFPTNGNGKVNRAALPTPDQSRGRVPSRPERM